MYNLHIKKEKGVPISPGMIGLFYEDINYACDGGLNAEMLENPAFEFVESFGWKDHYSTKYDGLYGWSAFPLTGDEGRLSIGTDSPVHPNTPHFLHFVPSRTQNAAANKAFSGVYLQEGHTYKVSAYLRSTGYTGSVTAAVYLPDSSLEEGADYKKNTVPAAQVVLAGEVTSEWVRYEAEFTAASTLRYGVFALVIDAPADAAVCGIDIDHVSLKPTDAVCGVFRRDLANILRDMHPGFLRFPGGCIVEGNTLSNRYQWKRSVGPAEGRISNWNRWATSANMRKEFSNNPFSHYNQTLAIGYYEYFLLCEYIGAEPLPVQHVGLACQFQSTQLIEPEAPEFREFVQDILDLIEFANGPVDSTWGKVRASMGHPEPFALKMIGIGNEQWDTKESRFLERYALIEKAVHDVYPDIRLLGSAGPSVSEPWQDKLMTAWNFYREQTAKKPNFTYAVDEHYYMAPEWLYSNSHFYDNYPRDVKVFAGEYAAHRPIRQYKYDKNTLDAALSEAAFLTGVERNADVVVLASYAPLFGRVDYSQWAPDLIWFDETACYGSVSYYVQKLYSLNMGTYTLPNTFGEEVPTLYQTVSYDEAASEVIIKLVNASDTPADIALCPEEGLTFTGTASAQILTHEDKDAYNELAAPTRVAPAAAALDPTSPFTVPAYSFSVIRIPASRAE